MRVWRKAVVSFTLCTVFLTNHSIFAVPEAPGYTAEEKFDWRVEVRNLLESFHISSPKFAEDQNDVQAMIRSLNDPYTQHFTSAESGRLLDSINGDAIAIGVHLGYDEDGSLYVSRVEPGSPADEAGLVEGDYIEAVEGRAAPAAHMLEQLGRKGKEEGSVVNVTVRRGGQSVEARLSYSRVHFSPVRSSFFNGEIGYIRLDIFTSDADKPFGEALHKLESQGMKALVLDLRNNPGGYVEAAKQIAAFFLGDGLLMKTRSREGEWETSIKGGRTSPYPIYVIVNERTASASEVLAGALQDREAATLIGTATYGKGVVQRLFPLLSGKGYLKVTAAEYVTPNGHPVHNKGIIPDIQAEGEVEPILRALKLAGADKLTFTAGKTNETIHGAVMPRQTRIIRMNGTIYAPVRLLAGLTDAAVSWDSAERSITLERHGSSWTLQADDSWTFMLDGTCYIDIEYVRQWFPSLIVMDDGEGLTLEAGL